MSRRRLSDEDAALWSGYVRSIKPLHGGADRRQAPAAGGGTVAQSEPRPAQPTPRPVQPKPSTHKPSTPTVAPLVPLGRRLKLRVARGREPIEARLDLHGMTQSQAHSALRRFLQRAQAAGARIVLVVTGKGGSGGESEPHRERGVLKRQVPIWLNLPEFRALVVGFDDAHASHGGSGAIYVRLRSGHKASVRVNQ